MRNLGDLNDLYNTQDEILLAEIIEIRFHWLQNTYGFNQENVILLVLRVDVLKEKCQKLFSPYQQNTNMLKVLKKP